MQAVAIAVTRVPDPDASGSRYHGATLSSFTSLTLHPHPLVAFSLRLPSRMADYLRPDRSPPITSPFPRDFTESPSSTRSPTPVSSSARPSTPGPAVSLTISLLSLAQQFLAESLSRPGLDQSPIFASPHFDGSDPPTVIDCIGSLRCEVVSSVLLRDICPPPASPQLREGQGAEDKEGKGELHGSEMFICRVASVIPRIREGKDRPLLYWRQRYVGVDEKG